MLADFFDGNLRLKWDSASLVEVTLEKAYHNQNCKGLCGDADGNSNNDGMDLGNAASFGNYFKGENVSKQMVVNNKSVTLNIL